MADNTRLHPRIQQTEEPGRRVELKSLKGARRFKEAINEIRKALSLSYSSSLAGYAGFILASSGRKTEGQLELDKLLALSKDKYVPAYYLAAIYSGLNEKDKAFEMLEKAFQQRSGLAGLKYDTMWDNIRSDPRYKEMLKRVSLPE